MCKWTVHCARCGVSIYCGEWIESHVLHIYMLHAPDFLGYESAIHMARDHAAIVQRGLQLKKAGNEIVALVGGRECLPINVRVGGFYRVQEVRTGAPERKAQAGARRLARNGALGFHAAPFRFHAGL